MNLQHPFTCLVSGPTGSGKTSLVKSIIELNVIQPVPQHIVWLYAETQPLYEEMRNVIFYKGIPDDLETRFDSHVNNLLVIDDLMTKCHSDERMTRLFSVGSSHKNLSIIFIVHNLFHHGKEMRNISLNTHYILLFKNPRDNQQIQTLGRQMYPGNSKFLIEAYKDATHKPHGYLLVDLKAKTPDLIRVRTGILPRDTHIVYTDTIINKPVFINIPKSNDVKKNYRKRAIYPLVSTQQPKKEKKSFKRRNKRGANKFI